VFTTTNLATFALYSAIGVTFFLVVYELEVAAGWSALRSGVAMLPATIMMLGLSAPSGALAQRIGARIPMTVGPLLIAVGLLLLTRIAPGQSYGTTVLPAAIVFGLGLVCTVAPLTSTVLASVDDTELGVASGVNNAAARLAGLLAVAVLPSLVGLDTTLAPAELTGVVAVALRICAALCVVGAAISWLTIGSAAPSRQVHPADLLLPCYDPCTEQSAA